MARVVVCESNRTEAENLVSALLVARHAASVCTSTSEVLDAAHKSPIDLIALPLDGEGFGRAGLVSSLRAVAPEVVIIVFHERPLEIIRHAAEAKFAAILPRPTTGGSLLYAVTRVLEQKRSLP